MDRSITAAKIASGTANPLARVPSTHCIPGARLYFLGMAIFQSDQKALLKRLADNGYGSTQERDQLLEQLGQLEGLGATDVV